MRTETEAKTPAAKLEKFIKSIGLIMQFMQYKGTFNVRIGAELHRQAAMAAMQRGDQSLNAFVTEAIREKIAHTAHMGAHG